MAYIITIRHGESYKNIKNIDGGLGEKLTPTGTQQVTLAAGLLKKVLDTLPAKKVKIFRSCNRTQILQTAEILGDVLGVEPQRDERFAPIRLGVFSGMSRAKQLELYPTSARQMDEWVEGTRDIMDVHVEGMQDPREHVDGIIDFLRSMADDEVIILVGTRSDISAIKNIAKGNHPAIRDSYRFFPTDFAEIQVASLNNTGGKLAFSPLGGKGRNNDGSER